MPSPTKPQLAIYAALAIAVLLIGARFLRHEGDPGTAAEDASGVVLPASTTDASSATGSAPDGASGGVDPAGGRPVVDVKGAVRRPGVYRLDAGARALDAVRRAGGMTRRADRLGVNLAARVSDGGQVIVPLRGAAAVVGAAGGPDASGASGAEATAPDQPLSLDVNSASEQELEQLDGVGPATAAKIVAYREQHGGFSSIDQLDDVSGIGPAKLAAIRAQLGQ